MAGMSVVHLALLATVLFLMFGVPLIALAVIWWRQRAKGS
jgi:hypothetical protein